MPTKPKRKLPSLNLDVETIGQRLARFRKERGYTQKELADKIGITFNIVSDYERGRLRLYDEMVTRFAIALDVSTDEILGLKQDNHKHVKPSLKIMRRLGKIESMPPAQQKTVLKSLDLMIKTDKK